MIFKAMFSRKWLPATFLAAAGMALCVRLGIWQLDRLDQRRIFNAQVESMRAAPELDLNDGVPAEIDSMEWRAVTVAGEPAAPAGSPCGPALGATAPAAVGCAAAGGAEATRPALAALTRGVALGAWLPTPSAAP